MHYKKIGEYPAHAQNPFVDEAISNIQKQTVRKTRLIKPHGELAKQAQQIIVHSESGEAVGYGAFMQFIEVDEEQFAKVYLNQFSIFWELSKPAIRVFGYVLSVLKPGLDSFIFQMDKALEYTKYSHNSHVFLGLSDLIRCGIIARSEYHYQYYINPLVFFNGNRVTFAKTYIRKRKQIDKTQLGLFDRFEEIPN